MINQGVFKFLTKQQAEAAIKTKSRIIPSSLFVKEKLDAAGNFEKLKARLVACGNFQAQNPEVANESPTIGQYVINIVLFIAAKYNMQINCIDIDGAYLHSNLKSKQLMRLSKTVAETLIKADKTVKNCLLHDGTMIVELQKGLYGLKEAGRLWYDLISSTLIKYKFIRSDTDKCLFIYGDGDIYCIIALYVDDMLICCTSNTFVDDLRAKLKKDFKGISEKTGNQLSFLGLEVTKNNCSDILVNQSFYIQQFVKEYGVTATMVTPTDASFLLEDKGEDANLCNDSNSFRSKVMKVMYVATRTRPDVLYATSILATKCNKPTNGDMKKLNRVIGYLAGTNNYGLLFRNDGDIQLQMYVDASFNHHRDARGHTGIMIFGDVNCSGSLLCKSIKQTTVAASSFEAELIAMAEAVQWLSYVNNIFNDCGINTDIPTVYEDNQSVINVLKNDTVNFHGRSKFVNRKYFAVHEKLQNNEIKLVFIGTTEMVADFLTKGLQGSQYRRFAVRSMGFTL